MEFELALAGALGRKLLGKADLASDVHFVKVSMLKIIDKWGERVRSISAMDERLDMMATSDLEELKIAVRDTSNSTNNDWRIISSLVSLINRLLGYDWVDGKVHRHVIYFRDKEQEDFDYSMGFPAKDALEMHTAIGKTLRTKYAIIDYLKNKAGITVNEIAKVMGQSEYYVRKVLSRVDQYEKNEGSEFSDISHLESTPLIYDEGYQKGKVWLAPWRSRRASHNSE